MLACAAVFELVTATQRRVLWSARIEAGSSRTVHTVSLEEPILMLIDVGFGRSDEGFLFHDPDTKMFSESTSIFLSDSYGQRLRIGLDINVGNGGQRCVTVYCPFWVVNASQYSIRLREEGGAGMPAGTVLANRYVLN